MMGTPSTFSICFVCLGNICRSPTAEGVARQLIEQRGLGWIHVDSAGTGGWHVGSALDHRATVSAARRGIRLDGAARQIVAAADLARYDLVVALDQANLRDLHRLADETADETADAPPIRLLREWDPHAADGDRDVPDPYYDDGLDDVLDIVTRSVAAMLDEVAAQHAAG